MYVVALADREPDATPPTHPARPLPRPRTHQSQDAVMTRIYPVPLDSDEPNPEPLRVGSLFAGYGGLDLAVQTVLPQSHLVWYCEHEPPTEKNPTPDQAAAAVMAHRWPGTPNLGDVTTINWSHVEPVDVLTGGFPCQDVSISGARRGMHADTRSGLWTHMANAIDTIRPGLVLIENVRGLLSAEAASNVEPCPWCLGDNGTSPMRALGRVLADLADIGYDAQWCGLPASSLGAPHGRYRIFILSCPAPDTSHQRLEASRAG